MDSVEVYSKKKRLAEAHLRGEDKVTILRLATELALAMGMKHSSLSGKRLRTVDEIVTAIKADGKVNIDNASVPPGILAQLKEQP